ncbi:UNVERIFIED_CONTAM: hypothetical protein RMT77_005392 [Armadillidium vulgare]
MALKLHSHNPMTFTENHHGNIILGELQKQRMSSRFCDVFIAVNESKYPAHRCVLSACSPYFASLLIADKVGKETVSVETEKDEDVLTVLDYMYTGTIIMDKNNVGEILKLADAFLMIALKDHCSIYLQHYLDNSNCLTIWEMANRFGLETVKKLSSKYISTHLSEILEGGMVLTTTKLRLENFIRSSEWKLSEEKLFDLITSWVYYDPEKREIGFRSLLTWISWQTISPDVVVNKVQEHPLYSLSPKCCATIIDVLNENCLLNQPEYQALASLRDNVNEQLFIDEDNDNFINLAITAAISDPNVDKYSMESAREFIKLDFKSPMDSSREFTKLDFKSQKILKNRNSDHRNEKRLLITKSQNVPSFHSHANKDFETDFDIERYQKEDYSKSLPQNEKDIEDRNFFNEQEVNLTKDCETLAYPVDASRNTCCHYKEFKETYRTPNCRNRCPNFSNKAAYMNHKYDAKHHTNELSLNQIHFHKNIPGSSEFNSPPYAFDLNKESSCSYFEESLNMPLNTAPHEQNNSLFLPADHKRSNLLNTEDLYDVKNEFQSSGLLLNERESMNAADNMRENTILSTFQQNFGNFDGSDDTQGSNNYPKDMSLPHLRLSDHFEADTNLREEGKSRDDHKFISTSEEGCETIEKQSNSLQNYEHSCCDDGRVIVAQVEKIITEQVPSSRVVIEDEKQAGRKSVVTSPKSNSSSNSKVKIKGKKMKSKEVQKEKDESDKPKKKEPKNSKKNCKSSEKMNNIVKTCDVCSKPFGRKKDYFSHMTEHFPGPTFTCDNCPSTFKRIYHLLDHRQIHKNDKSFKCPHCSFSSHREFNLKEHMSVHSTVDKPFKCEECGQSFNRKQLLTVHKTKHTSERPFTCGTCGWSAKTRNSLVVHSKIHSGDLYTCQYRDCPYRTPKKSHLKEHMQFHTKSRPFTCHICGLRFISKTHLRRHLRKHETPNLYQCFHCDYCTSRQDSLKIHIKRKHTASKPKVILRTGQLKKKDALLSNKKSDMLLMGDQREYVNLNSSGHLSPNPPFPTLPETFSQYQPPPSSPSRGFGNTVDPDDPTLSIVSEIEDSEGSYLGSNISQALSGFLEDASCGDDRFVINSSDVLYYS